mmetsp:Transcript_10054/g.24554  ORF Transcript_10054/g.24554 Transcript_10054/m.24554 type:complete len:269 (-) Transcript_10054:170-976(-)
MRTVVGSAARPSASRPAACAGRASRAGVSAGMRTPCCAWCGRVQYRGCGRLLGGATEGAARGCWRGRLRRAGVRSPAAGGAGGSDVAVQSEGAPSRRGARADRRTRCIGFLRLRAQIGNATHSIELARNNTHVIYRTEVRHHRHAKAVSRRCADRSRFGRTRLACELRKRAHTMGVRATGTPHGCIENRYLSSGRVRAREDSRKPCSGALSAQVCDMVSRYLRMNLPPTCTNLYELSCPALYQCPSPFCDGGEAHGRWPGDAPGGSHP